jgi:hypothetical protein
MEDDELGPRSAGEGLREPWPNRWCSRAGTSCRIGIAQWQERRSLAALPYGGRDERTCKWRGALWDNQGEQHGRRCRRSQGGQARRTAGELDSRTELTGEQQDQREHNSQPIQIGQLSVSG